MMTQRERDILQMLVDGEDIFWDGGRIAYVGIQKTSAEMIYRLIRNMWIKQDGQSFKSPYWEISGLGREALESMNA